MQFGDQKTALVALAILSAALAAGCDGSSRERGADRGTGNAAARLAPRPGEDKAPAPDSDPNRVVIDNFAFSPAALTVTTGTRVTWVNRDDVPHTATSTARPRLFDSRTLDTDERFSHVFTAPGTYEYFCAVHPHMTGRIVVK
jgi:plastocyanin